MKLFPPKEVEKDWKFDVAWCIFFCWQLSPKLLHDESCWGQPHNRCNPTNQKFPLKGRLVEWRFSRSSVGKISKDVRGQKHRRFFRCFCLGRREFSLHGKPHQRLNFHENLSTPPWIFFEENAFIYLPMFLGDQKMLFFFFAFAHTALFAGYFQSQWILSFSGKGEGWNEKKKYYILYT